LHDMAVTQRGWTLDVLNVVRHIISEGRAPRDPNVGRMGARRTRSSDSFTTADAHAFTRDLEVLADGHHASRHFEG
jgi:hypothetical protein